MGSLFQADKKKTALPLVKCAEWKPAFTDCVKAEKFEIGREKFAWDQSFCSRYREVRDMEVRDRERKLGWNQWKCPRDRENCSR